MKRRYFSAGLLGGVAAAGSGIASAALSAGTVAPRMQQPVFQAMTNARVLIRAVGADGGISARVSAVECAGRQGQFYVRVSALKPAEFAEGLYLLETPGSDEMLLHMSPSASNPHTLEAVINHTVA